MHYILLAISASLSTTLAYGDYYQHEPLAARDIDYMSATPIYRRDAYYEDDLWAREIDDYSYDLYTRDAAPEPAPSSPARSRSHSVSSQHSSSGHSDGGSFHSAASSVDSQDFEHVKKPTPGHSYPPQAVSSYNGGPQGDKAQGTKDAAKDRAKQIKNFVKDEPTEAAKLVASAGSAAGGAISNIGVYTGNHAAIATGGTLGGVSSMASNWLNAKSAVNKHRGKSEGATAKKEAKGKRGLEAIEHYLVHAREVNHARRSLGLEPMEFDSVLVRRGLEFARQQKREEALQLRWADAVAQFDDDLFDGY